jgi:DNA-binding response OmpR family regulator
MKGLPMPHLPAPAPVREPLLQEPVASTGSERILPDEAIQPALGADQQRPTVVVVLPTKSACAAFVAHLPAPEYAVWAVWTGAAALEVAEGLSTGVLVLDLDGRYAMSRVGAMISGVRLLALLGCLARGRPVAIMVLTRLDYAEVEGAVRAHADDVVTLPVSPAHLISRLRAALGRVRIRHQQSGAARADPWLTAGGVRSLEEQSASSRA